MQGLREERQTFTWNTLFAQLYYTTFDYQIFVIWLKLPLGSTEKVVECCWSQTPDIHSTQGTLRSFASVTPNGCLQVATTETTWRRSPSNIGKNVHMNIWKVICYILIGAAPESNLCHVTEHFVYNSFQYNL